MKSQQKNNFWTNKPAWIKAARNTLNCLIGCSIGDFSTIIAFQTLRPESDIMLVMGLAMINGLITSIILETTLLHLKEGFTWIQSLRTAFSMSFLSMLAMELAENSTDYFLTGGTVKPSEAFYWFALAAALCAGFLVPLPYNYYKFRKHGVSCH